MVQQSSRTSRVQENDLAPLEDFSVTTTVRPAGMIPALLGERERASYRLDDLNIEIERGSISGDGFYLHVSAPARGSDAPLSALYRISPDLSEIRPLNEEYYRLNSRWSGGAEQMLAVLARKVEDSR